MRMHCICVCMQFWMFAIGAAGATVVGGACLIFPVFVAVFLGAVAETPFTRSHPLFFSIHTSYEFRAYGRDSIFFGKGTMV